MRTNHSCTKPSEHARAPTTALPKPSEHAREPITAAPKSSERAPKPSELECQVQSRMFRIS
jgi:hypothetical protein